MDDRAYHIEFLSLSAPPQSIYTPSNWMKHVHNLESILSISQSQSQSTFINSFIIGVARNAIVETPYGGITIIPSYFIPNTAHILLPNDKRPTERQHHFICMQDKMESNFLLYFFYLLFCQLQLRRLNHRSDSVAWCGDSGEFLQMRLNWLHDNPTTLTKRKFCQMCRPKCGCVSDWGQNGKWILICIRHCMWSQWFWMYILLGYSWIVAEDHLQRKTATNTVFKSLNVQNNVEFLPLLLKKCMMKEQFTHNVVEFRFVQPRSVRWSARWGLW